MRPYQATAVHGDVSVSMVAEKADEAAKALRDLLAAWVKDFGYEPSARINVTVADRGIVA